MLIASHSAAHRVAGSPVTPTFVNGLFSVDVRVPFATTLSSHLDLSTGAAQETGAGLFDVTPTPFQSLGTEATEFGNVTAILKMLIHESPSTIFSGGFGVNAPTGRDSRIAVTDYFGFLLDFTAADVGSPVPGPRFLDLGLETQRSRLFEIDNEAWSVSPFLSVAHAPPERWFTNGFLQIEAPLNQNSVRYRRKYRFAEPITLTELTFGGTGVLDDVAAEFELQEQTLLHCDVGTGYWLYRNPCAPRIRGLAGLMELHYTTTLNDADVAVIPGEPGTLRPIASIEQQAFVPQTQTAVIGNAANRLDILNLTAGTTLLLGDRTTIATAVVVPLRDGADKLFDLEFNLQLNYFPGSLSNLNFGS